MPTKQIATFIKKTPIGDDTFLIEYRVNKTTKTMGVSKGSNDYTLAEQLKPGMKFVIEHKIKHITPGPGMNFIPFDCPLPYIKKIETR